ncbi:MAG: glutathione S-transferase N-terminal domain-containing protein [Alphaproteobacteria bacterium]|nr:glutathione S-transferase N-terminal domain-containing protein [Alphaproteobacteria bacterium]
MRLFGNAMSPYGRKVHVVIHEHGLADKVALVDVNPRQKPEAVIPVSALGKIPILVLDDGTAIKDSPVIAEYLDAEFGGAKLLARSGLARWKALTRIADCDGIIEASILVRNERLRPAAQQSADFIAWNLDKVKRMMAELESQAAGLDKNFDLGTIAVACVLGYVPRRLPEFEGLATSHPGLSALRQRLLQRPSIAATEPA